MSTANQKALRELKKTVEKHTPLVEKRLSRAGISSDPAIVFSIAQYYDTLKKLAKK